MRKKHFSRHKWLNDDSAFTLVEAAAALAILSTLVIIAMAAVSGSASRVFSYLRDSSNAQRILVIESALRRSIGKIEAPFWAPASFAAVTETIASASYYEGKAEASISITVVDEYCSIQTPRGTERYGPFKSIRVSLIRGPGGAPVGFSFAIETKGRTIMISAVFSSAPLLSISDRVHV